MSVSNSPLYRILNPRSVCIIGASDRMNRLGTWALLNILGSGYKGSIYLVHSKHQEIHGIKTFQSIDSLPETPELMLLAIPRTIVPEVLEQAGRKGIRRAVVITGGYSETGEEGRDLQKKIDDVVERFGINYIGPNCIGFVNSQTRINTSPIPFDGRKGGIGFASQSGSYVCHSLPYAEAMGMGIAEWISMGNEGSLDVVDALDYFHIHPNVRVVGLYLEGIRRPEAFKKAALRLAKKKPLVALYAGGTPEGARSAASHTATVSSSGRIMRGFLRQCGILQADSSTELYEWLNAFERQPLPNGPRVAILCNSGGPATSMADYVGKSELELPSFSTALTKRIGEFMPHTGSCTNPIDFTFSPNPSVYADKLPQILAEADEIDAILVYGIFGDRISKRIIERAKVDVPLTADNILFEMTETQADTMIKAFKGCGKPVLGASFDLYKDQIVRRIMEKGNIPFYDGPERAVKALEALWRYKKLRNKLCL